MPKNRETILAGLRAIEDYRAAHRKLHDSWTADRGIAAAHDPLIARMNARLNSLGFDSLEMFYSELKQSCEQDGWFPYLIPKVEKLLKVVSIGDDAYIKSVYLAKVVQEGIVSAYTIAGKVSHMITIPAGVNPEDLLDVDVCTKNAILILQDSRQCGVLWADRGSVSLTMQITAEPAWGIITSKLMYLAQKAALESFGATNITSRMALLDDGSETDRTLEIFIEGAKVGVTHEYVKPKSWPGDANLVVMTSISLTADQTLMNRAIKSVSNATKLMLKEVPFSTQIGRVLTAGEYLDVLLPNVSSIFNIKFQEVTLADLGL